MHENEPNSKIKNDKNEQLIPENDPIHKPRLDARQVFVNSDNNVSLNNRNPYNVANNQQHSIPLMNKHIIGQPQFYNKNYFPSQNDTLSLDQLFNPMQNLYPSQHNLYPLHLANPNQFGSLLPSINKRKPLIGTSKTNLYIAGLSDDATDEHILDIIKDIIKPKSCKALRNTNGCSGIAFIDCYTEMDAQKAFDHINDLITKINSIRDQKSSFKSPESQFFENSFANAKDSIFLDNNKLELSPGELESNVVLLSSDINSTSPKLNCKNYINNGDIKDALICDKYKFTNGNDNFNDSVNLKNDRNNNGNDDSFSVDTDHNEVITRHLNLLLKISKKDRKLEIKYANENEKDPFNVYVRNLPKKYTEKEFRKYFSFFGSVVSVKLLESQNHAGFTGAGFVRFESSESANRAIQHINSSEIYIPPSCERLQCKQADRTDRRNHSQSLSTNSFHKQFNQNNENVFFNSLLTQSRQQPYKNINDNTQQYHNQSQQRVPSTLPSQTEAVSYDFNGSNYDRFSSQNRQFVPMNNLNGPVNYMNSTVDYNNSSNWIQMPNFSLVNQNVSNPNGLYNFQAMSYYLNQPCNNYYLQYQRPTQLAAAYGNSDLIPLTGIQHSFNQQETLFPCVSSDFGSTPANIDSNQNCLIQQNTLVKNNENFDK